MEVPEFDVGVVAPPDPGWATEGIILPYLPGDDIKRELAEKDVW